MPSIFSSIPAEIERKAPGTGGKPPVDRRPTGGGGGGDDDWDRRQRRGPREALYRTRAFVFCALAGDLMFFLALVVLFYAHMDGAATDLRPLHPAEGGHPALLPPLLFLNTAALLLSCLAMERARRHIFREIDVLEEWLGLGRPALRRTLPWLGLTAALGLLFLGGQFLAWHQFIAQGYAFDRWTAPSSYFFFVITGLHAAHVAFAILLLALCLVALGQLRRVELRQIAVDAAAWLWYTLGLIWLVIFAVLALGQ